MKERSFKKGHLRETCLSPEPIQSLIRGLCKKAFDMLLMYHDAFCELRGSMPSFQMSSASFTSEPTCGSLMQTPTHGRNPIAWQQRHSGPTAWSNTRHAHTHTHTERKRSSISAKVAAKPSVTAAKLSGMARMQSGDPGSRGNTRQAVM